MILMHLIINLLKASAENLFLLQLNSALSLRRKWISSPQRKTSQISHWSQQIEESLSSFWLSASILMMNLSHLALLLPLYCSARNLLRMFSSSVKCSTSAKSAFRFRDEFFSLSKFNSADSSDQSVCKCKHNNELLLHIINKCRTKCKMNQIVKKKQRQIIKCLFKR